MQAYLLGLLLALSLACAGERPLVERHENGAWQPEPFRLFSLSGQRDGTEVSFAMELQGDGRRRLLVIGTVIIDPRARLMDGSWEESKAGVSHSGVISSAAIDFLGGQGGRPSMGGQFVLADSDGPRYRLNLATGELSPPR